MSLSLVIEEIDDTTQCISAEVCFDAPDIGELGRLLQIDLSDDQALECEYELSGSDIGALINYYSLVGLTGGKSGNLRARARFDDIPYQLHTGRELTLMLSGDKPMAYFMYHDEVDFRDPIEEAFGRFLVSHNIARHEFTLPLDEEGQRIAHFIVFTLPGEDWRAQALILLMKSSVKGGWNEGMVRMEGSLLGYEDWQNDLHIEYYRKNMI